MPSIGVTNVTKNRMNGTFSKSLWRVYDCLVRWARVSNVFIHKGPSGFTITIGAVTTIGRAAAYIREERE